MSLGFVQDVRVSDGTVGFTIELTTPDAIGLAIKRDLLDRAVAADPDADEFEGWLLEQCAAAGPAEGGMRAMALSIFEEWRLALSAGSFGDWLAQGAPSDDASGDLTP